MRVLIAVGSRHGSTWAIGELLASRLEASGHTVDVEDAGAVTTVAPYDAVVAGSAVYMGQWMAESKGFVKRFREDVKGTPTYVFSSGPIDGYPEGDPPGHIAACEALLPYDDRVFAGRLDRKNLNVLERSVTRVLKAPEGDYRDWEEIAAWGEDIAGSLDSFQPGLVPSERGSARDASA